MKFLTSIDLSKNELLNARIQNLTTDPANAVAGQVYFNTSDKKLKVYNGTKWENAGVIITDTTAGDGKINVDGEEVNIYTHPSHTAADVGLYKITVDALGHVTAVTAVEKKDITGLGIPSEDTKVANLTANTGKVVTSLSNNTTLGTTDVKNLTLDGITPVEGGYVSNGDTLASAFSALDTAVKNAVAGGGEVNQNAFSNVKVGSTTIAADTKTDTLELAAGTGITLTPDATTDKVTIKVTDNTYADKSHNHGNLTNDGKIGTTAGKVITTSTNGTLVASDAISADNVPSLNASKINAGTFDVARIPNITLSKVTDSGTAAAANVATGAIADASTDNGLVTAAQVATYVGNKTAGLSGAMHFLGVSTTAIKDGDPVGSITVDGKTVTPAAGDVVLYGNKEFVCTSTAWEELGDEGSYVLKTQTINGKALSGNITLTATDVGADPTGEAGKVQTNLTKHEGDTTKHITADERSAWNGKQNAISDLGTIRSGASKGATSVQNITGTLQAGSTSISVTFAGSPVNVCVRDATDGMIVGADVKMETNKVTVSIAQAYTANLNIEVQYK